MENFFNLTKFKNFLNSNYFNNELIEFNTQDYKNRFKNTTDFNQFCLFMNEAQDLGDDEDSIWIFADLILKDNISQKWSIFYKKDEYFVNVGNINCLNDFFFKFMYNEETMTNTFIEKYSYGELKEIE